MKVEETNLEILIEKDDTVERTAWSSTVLFDRGVISYKTDISGVEQAIKDSIYQIYQNIGAIIEIEKIETLNLEYIKQKEGKETKIQAEIKKERIGDKEVHKTYIYQDGRHIGTRISSTEIDAIYHIRTTINHGIYSNISIEFIKL